MKIEALRHSNKEHHRRTRYEGTLALVFMLSLFMLNNSALKAQVVINEILPGGTIELKNIGNTTVDVSGYWLCDFPSYQQVSNSSLDCGNNMMAPGDLLTVNNFNVVDAADGEMGLYTSNSFGSSSALIDYVEWGSTGHQRSSVAVAAGIWTTGAFVPAFGSNESLAYSGSGEGVASWTASATTTICAENGGGCDAMGGTLTGGPFEFCVGDGVADNVSGITLAGNTGTNSQWVVTDEDGTILGLPPMPGVVNFDGAGNGTCLIWHLSYEDGLTGLAVDMNANDLQGCFNLSNPVTVVRNGVNGGTLTGGPFEFCVGDGVADNVSGITLSGNEGTNSQWVVTDESGTILGLPPMPGAVDFDGAGNGTCLIWHLSYEDGLTGLAVDMNANDLQGCFNLSNPVTVVRNGVNGGTLEGGPFEFCVGDGVADNVSGITLSGNEGTNSQWVVTDEAGTILGLPPMPGVVDFDGAGNGTCLIWHLSYEDGLTGLAVDMNANDLQGCFDLSNPIVVARNGVNGGTIEGGPFEFCVGDGIADNVSGITLAGNEGANSQWLITDEDGTILGLPPMPGAADFDGAGGGTCLIWHLSYADGLEGLEMNMNANDLQGCFSLSNSIAVVRNNVDGGNLSTADNATDLTICAGDGTADPFDVNLTGADGANTAWVITDAEGTILGLPAAPPFDLEGAGEGVCLVWHLAYEDGLTGLAVDMNANDLEGCFDLSNPITVTRIVTDGLSGGTLEGGPFEFCVGDGVADNVSGITLTGNSGTNMQWIVTDEQGNILGLPPMPGAVDFDGAGPGTCLIWNLAYEDGIVGLAMDMNANDLQGCFSLSNPISVVRNQPEGGMLEGGPFEFCVGDGVADNVSGITLTGNTGTNSQWVVTDEQGLILGLPPMPGAVDFDGAGGGVCLIWHLSYEDGLAGLEVDQNANDLEGCFNLSNPISVIRNQAEGGTLEGGPFEFCVGDGVADNVSGITLSGNVGDSTQWIITDEQGTILGLPPMPGVVDFDGAGGGSCFIWHLSYYGDITGLEADLNANDLLGCFSLSNSIEVVRVTEGELCTTSTDDFGSVSALDIYPNPAGNFVEIAYEGLETGRGVLQLVDLTGRTLQEQLLRQDKDNIRLDISGISGGYYFIRIDNGERTTAEKLVILK